MSDSDPSPVVVRVEKVSKVFKDLRMASTQLRSIFNRLFHNTDNDRNDGSEEVSAEHIEGFRALNDISFEVRKGESIGIIGVNGSGKSTLLRIIAGSLRPTSGTVDVKGKVGILDIGSGINEEYTGRENVYLKAAIHGMSKRRVDELYQDIADYAGIGDFMEKQVKTYSSGMKARLGFAIIAHIDVDVLITDEALAVGDMFFVQKSMRTIRQFLETGTFLFVTHSLNDVLALCNRAIWLEHGEIKKIGPAKDVVDAYIATEQNVKSMAYAENKKNIENNVNVSNKIDEITVDQPEISKRTNSRPPRITIDPRQDLLKQTQWRNDIKIPAFDKIDKGHGVGGARIIDVIFEDLEGNALSWIIGAEQVRLQIKVAVDKEIEHPIVGFQMKDRLGQTLFADNTYIVTLEDNFSLSAGDVFLAEFSFQMPLLPVGEYIIRIAVADGIEDENAVLNCIDDALVINSITSGSRHGLLGQPMHKISLRRIEQ